MWARALKAAGIRHRPSYQLRHTFATQCIIKGLPLPYVAKVLGHSTIDTLIRHYAGWVDNVTKEHDEILKQAFASKSPP
ncbi:tyrosine-type recombinase/integrase, partial [Acinetobacter baumannii]